MHEMLPGLNGIGEERACTHHCLHLALLQKGYLRTQSPTQGRARDQGTGSAEINNFCPNCIFILRNLLICTNY